MAYASTLEQIHDWFQSPQIGPIWMNGDEDWLFGEGGDHRATVIRSFGCISSRAHAKGELFSETLLWQDHLTAFRKREGRRAKYLRSPSEECRRCVDDRFGNRLRPSAAQIRGPMNSEHLFVQNWIMDGTCVFVHRRFPWTNWEEWRRLRDDLWSGQSDRREHGLATVETSLL